MKVLDNVLKNIPTDCLQRGSRWYEDAHDFATYLSDTYKVSFDRVCGVISALSPENRWENNKLEAERLITCYVCGGDFTRLSFRTYASNVVKAWEILTANEREVDSFFSPKTGAKTLHFYKNILNPRDDRYVTLDRHMIAVIEGRLGNPSGSAKLTPKQYKNMVSDFIRVAKKYNMLPNQLQASVWEYHLTLINAN